MSDNETPPVPSCTCTKIREFAEPEWQPTAAQPHHPDCPQAAAPPPPTPKNDPVFCSFCGKNRREVLALVSGPQVCICDECFQGVADILGGEALRGVHGRHAYAALEAYRAGRLAELLVALGLPPQKEPWKPGETPPGT